jgi:hypothetical protein
MAALLLQVLRKPACALRFALADWDLLLRQAACARLDASLLLLLEEHGLLDQVPAAPREHLEWTRAQLLRHSQAVRWEVHQIQLALAPLGLPLILLKGSAYVMAQLPAARGRLFSDVDILVPKEALDKVESQLLLNGWVGSKLDEYDQRYYRNWMHELPPMQHAIRGGMIDVHHAILPETGKVRPDPLLLRAAAVGVPGQPGLQVFAPVDMVLHSAVHLFHDGELDHGLRDIFDLHRLLAQFGAEAGFWQALQARAVQLGAQRILFYALRYTTALLETPVPQAAIDASRTGAPHPLLLALMDTLFLRALQPNHASCDDWLSGASRFLVYIRANWLRMPPLMLARHLFHKAFISPKHS